MMLLSSHTLNPETADLGLAIGRVVLGTLFAAHGGQKLFGWFRGPGLDATGQFFSSLGFRHGRSLALAAGLTELTSGFLIVLGLFGPLGPALLLSVMIVAVITVHWGNGLLATSNGSELPILYSAAAISLALVGYGPHSLDAVLGFPAPQPFSVTLSALLLGMLGGLVNVAARRPAALHPREVREGVPRLRT